MNKKEIEIKVDVKRQFQLLRKTAFKDPLCFLDEDIQNADRSGAKEVHVTYDNQTLTIENNGSVLVEPDILFTIGKSGWDEDIQESENPFGMGFFSNLPTSNFIEVYSGHHRVVFDEREEMSIYAEEIDTAYDGFKLILHNFHLDGIYSWDIEERVELLGKHIHHIAIFYNGREIEKKSLTEGDGLPFEYAIHDHTSMTGWLSLTKDFFPNPGIQIFYKGRLVTNLDHLYYVKGELHVTDKTLTLQSPDRKDIIKDEKLRKFKQEIRVIISEMAEMAVLTGDETAIKQHEEGINQYIQASSIRHRMPFTVFSGKTSEDMDFLSDMTLAISKNEQLKTIGEYEVYLRKQEEQEKESETIQEVAFTFEEDRVVDTSTSHANKDEQETPASRPIYREEPAYVSTVHNETHTETVSETTPKSTLESKKSGQKMYVEEDNQEPIFWVKLDELTEYKKRISLIKQYGIRLIVAQNMIQINILEQSSDKHIYHIKQLEEKVTIKSHISNTTLNKREQRASMLLDMVSRMYGFEKNVFQIGDVMVTKLIDVPQLGLSLENIEESINVVANKRKQLIYVDRFLIEESLLNEHTEETLELADYKFLLLHLKHIIEEVNLLGMPNKEELYEKTLLALAIA